MSTKLKLLLGVLVVGTIFLFGRVGFSVAGKFRTANINTASSGADGVLRVVPAKPDQDHDGLTDAEEASHHTDITNPDTDGDGYTDGEEVLAGYNPNESNPGRDQAQYDLSKNLTESYVDRFLAGYAADALNPEKIAADLLAQNIEMISQTALNDAQRILANLSPDTISTTVAKNDQEARRYYLTRSRALLDLASSEYTFFDQVTSNVAADMSSSVIKQFSNEIYLKKNTEKKFAALPPPMDLLAWHQDVVKTLGKMIVEYKIFTMLETDPILAILTLDNMPATFEHLFELEQQFKSYK